MKILLHICCAPCTIYPLRILKGEGNEICGLFYNPNIHPYLEYKKRLDTVISYAGEEGFAVIREESYPIETFLRQVAFREEERCRSCYRIRLFEAARMAGEGGFDAFTTTLLYSRYQKHDLIRQIGADAAAAQGVPFLYRDFREGWSEGVRISKERGMYRQPYCGCIFSEKERYCPKAGTKAKGDSAGSTKPRPEIARGEGPVKGVSLPTQSGSQSAGKRRKERRSFKINRMFSYS